MLEVRDLSVDREGARVLHDASFRAQRGEMVAVVGPNGSGKTTLLEAVVGLRAAHGRVALDNDTLDSFRRRAAAFAYMPDEASLPEEASVATILRAHSRDPVSVEREARRFEVEPLLARGGGALSRGEQKRVWLAATVLRDRPVIVLDEPFGAFDPLQLDRVLPSVKEVLGDRRIAIVTIHQMSIAERIADRIVMLASGRVVAEGTLAELRDRTGLSGGSLDDIFRSVLEKDARDVAP